MITRFGHHPVWSLQPATTPTSGGGDAEGSGPLSSSAAPLDAGAGGRALVGALSAAPTALAAVLLGKQAPPVATPNLAQLALEIVQAGVPGWWGRGEGPPDRLLLDRVLWGGTYVNSLPEEPPHLC